MLRICQVTYRCKNTNFDEKDVNLINVIPGCNCDLNLFVFPVHFITQKVTDEYMKKIDSIQKQKEKVYLL